MNEQERLALKRYFEEQRRHLIAQVRACEAMLASLESKLPAVETEVKTGYNISKQS